MEGSLVAYKVFTNGSTLQASEINENLMRQSVMVFSNAAARTAAITAPVEGMLSWLEDVNRYESFNGSSWVSPFGSTLVATSTFTSTTSVALDNIFTSEFRVYDYYFTASSVTANQISIRGRLGSSDNSLSNYTSQRATFAGTGSVIDRGHGDTNWSLFTTRTTPGAWHGSIFNPVTVDRTQITATGMDSTAPSRMEIGAGEFYNNASFNGIRFFGGSNMTGYVSIYGRRS
jgi:hypothetical protein